MTTTIWNSGDLSNVTLSGGSLTATGTGALLTEGVRSVDSQNSGKFYWEITVGTWAVSNTCTGVSTGGSAYTSSGLYNGVNGIVVSRGGVVVMNGANATLTSGSTISLGTITSGTLCFAVDMNAKMFWVRLGAAGNWNNNASANPATGVLGVFFGSLYGDAAFYSFFCPNSTDSATANFGGSSFVGTVPSGFTSGFSTGSPALVGVASQVAVEQWVSDTAAAQITQMASEHWSSPTSAGIRGLVSTIAVEHWGTAPSAGGSGSPLGVSATGHAGTVAPSIAKGLTGVAAVGAAAFLHTAPPVFGVSATGHAGSVGPEVSVGLVGVSADGAAGSIAAAGSLAFPHLVGVAAIGHAGLIASPVFYNPLFFRIGVF